MTNEIASEASLEKLVTLVQQRLNGRVRDLRLLLCGQAVILQGHSSTYYAKQLAQHAVIEISGLSILANEIEVR